MKIFTCSPKPFFPKGYAPEFIFSRDMGLTCHALREAGHDSMVVYAEGKNTENHTDIIRATVEQMESSEWWAQLHLDAVVLGSWAAPQYTLIAKAIKESSAKVIIRCDSGAPYSQWQKGVWGSLYGNYLGSRYKGKCAAYAGFYSLLKTACYYLPAIYEKKVIKHMSYADLILNEAPEGVRYLKALLCRYGRMDIAARVKYVPHPVAGEMGYSAGIQKQSRIISVGRWDSYQKNASLLIGSLAYFLQEYPDYEAHIFGGGEDILRKQMLSVPEPVKARIHIRGKVPNEELAAEYQKSRIFFAPSRSESFNIAAAEALCCGCSFVGSGHVFSFRNFVSKNSGTLARRYSVKSMTEALTIEIMAWEEGLRDPMRSASLWFQEVHRHQITNHILSAVMKKNGKMP